jgi:hypothetical protein
MMRRTAVGRAALSGDPQDIDKTDAEIKRRILDNPHLHNGLDMTQERMARERMSRSTSAGVASPRGYTLEKQMGIRRRVLVPTNADQGLDGQTGMPTAEVAQRRRHSRISRSALLESHGCRFRPRGFQGSALRTRPYQRLPASRLF